jgi:hypothetical protein
MKMKYTMNKNEFINEFKNIRADNFSYEALDAFYDYLICLEEDTGEELQFDPVAWCCEYTYLPGPWLLCAATASHRRGTIELSDIKKIY